MNHNIKKIYENLFKHFSPISCKINDEAKFHIGHKGLGHYHIYLVSTKFEGKNRLTRHRLIHNSLSKMMKKDIHALTIIALAPSELET